MSLSESRFPAIATGVKSARSVSKDCEVAPPPSLSALTPLCVVAAKEDKAAESSPRSRGEVELLELKQTLRQQQQRLSTHTPRRPAASEHNALTAVYHPVAGQHYAARPYHRIPPKPMWEPSFSTDKDVVELSDRLHQSEERLEHRRREMEVQWSHQAQLFSALNAAAAENNEAGNDAAASLSSKAMLAVLGPAAGDAIPSLAGSGEHLSSRQNSLNPNATPSTDDGPFFRVEVESAEGGGTSFDVDDPHSRSGRVDRDNRSPRARSLGGSTTADPTAAGLEVPSLLRRRTSSVRVSHGTVAVLAMLKSTADMVLPAPKEVELERNGDVLSATHILKQDLFEAAFTRRDLVGVMSGAPYFRMVPKFHIGGVAQAHAHGIRTALNEMRKARATGPICWVNLREEPIIYLNGKSHIIRLRSEPLKPQIIPNISGPRIAQMEEKLRREVLEEAKRNHGNVCVHHESANGMIDEQWECAEEEDLMTMEELFARMNARGMNVEYRRRPITQGAVPQAADFQYVLELCQEYPESPIVFNCQTGRGRSSLMMLATTIVRFYQMCSQDINADVTLLRIDGKAGAYRSLQKLISLLPDGALHERRVAVLMELSDKIYSVADHINAALRSHDTSNTEKSRMRLAQYAYMLMFSCYCEQLLWSRTTTVSFPQWVEDFQEVKVIIHNISTSRHAPFIEERITTPDVVESEEVEQIVRRRRGHVLSSNMVLRSSPKEIAGAAATSVPGVLALRQLAADIPIFTCGRVSEAGREELLYNIRSGFPQVSKTVWVSLRAEPMIFINGTGYHLMERSALSEEAGDSAGTMHVSRERLEEIEDRLLKDVQQESQYFDGFLIVHTPSVNEDRRFEAQKIAVQTLQTPRDVMAEFAASSGVQYFRAPLPFSGALLATDLDPLISLFQMLFEDMVSSGEAYAFVINDGDGGMRTTIALNLATMLFASNMVPLRDVTDAAKLHDMLRLSDEGFSLSTSRCYYGMDEEESLPEEENELQVASVALQMAAAGSLLKFVQAVVALGGSGTKWNLLHAIDLAKQKLAPTDKSSPAVMSAVELVRKYLLILLAATYIDEAHHRHQSSRRPDAPTFYTKFSEWLASLSELQMVLDRLDERPVNALKYVDRGNLMTSTVTDRAVHRRCGDVLTANFAMKADHFPGCQKKGLRPQICGAPNFRKVDNINVFGVAIPTLIGVHNILSVLGAIDEPLVQYGNDLNDEEMHLGYASPRLFDDSFVGANLSAPLRGQVVWVNLREEPIIYVGDRPFVFRDLQQPYVNVELTGIEAEKIEHVENTLKRDILREADLYDGNFLVHDEGKPGELVGIWEVANSHTVLTVREVYDEAARKGARVTFMRLPVTDEQSPELKDFDNMVEHLLPVVSRCSDSVEPTSFVFNCQMGRGRTTTGMVVCALLIGLTNPEYYEHLDKRYPQLFAPTDSQLSRGNYVCIQQLKSILADGREAKKRVDLVLEACSRMQNLRTAIEGFVLQVSSPDVTEEARARAHHHGVHYLQRYFNLIAFTSYLHEAYDRDARRLRKGFEEWMNERSELLTLHNSASLQ